MVAVDRPIKALSMHIQKPYKGIIVYVLIAVILSKKNFQRDSFMHMFNVSKSYWQYQIVPSKAVVGVDWPTKAPSMHIQKPYEGKIVILSKIIFS